MAEMTLRLYNSILYKHFGDDFPDQSKNTMPMKMRHNGLMRWGQDTEDCYILQIQYFLLS